MSGLTTMLGGGTGPAEGTKATTCTPGPWHIEMMLRVVRCVPDQSRLCRQGQRLAAGAARRDDRGGRLRAEAARGLGHDAGRDRQLPRRCRRSRRAGDDPHRHAQRIRLRRGHRSRAFKGRTIHAFHTEGAGGGHAPDIIKVAGLAERAAVLDQPDAALHRQHPRRASRHAHGLPPSRSGDPGGPRLRREPHPQGDDRRRGHPARSRRALDDVLRQPGHGPHRRGHHPHLADRAQDEGRSAARWPRTRGTGADNFRVKRYVAKYTINPAIAHGVSRHIGSVEDGKFADLVLWSPAFFGVKPDLIIKGGAIAAAPMGDPNASIPTPQPVHYRPMFGAFGKARTATSLTFVSAGGARQRPQGPPRPRQGARRRRERARRHLQEIDDPQRRDARHRGRSGDLSGDGGRRIAGLRARNGATTGAALFLVLRRCSCSAPPTSSAKPPSSPSACRRYGHPRPRGPQPPPRRAARARAASTSCSTSTRRRRSTTATR